VLLASRLCAKPSPRILRVVVVISYEGAQPIARSPSVPGLQDGIDAGAKGTFVAD
jgi:hypothetical protein